jgi:hypothetical protein
VASKIAIAFIIVVVIAVAGYLAVSSFGLLSWRSSGGSGDLYSNNWSGYLATSDSPFSFVSSRWTVPSVSQLSGAGYSSVWVGIGGIGSSNRLIQAGTEQDIQSDGSTQYYAWFEALPRPPVNLGTVAPGDSISVSISKLQNSASTWHVSLSKSSQGISSVLFSGDVQVRASASSRSSAEFIVEAPSAVSGRQSELLPLADFKPITFSNCITDHGGLSKLQSVYRMSITSTGTSTGKMLASPGPLSADSFTVSRT